MDSEIQTKLTKLAFKRSSPFCYGCYKEAPIGRCNSCGSDDLMRILPGVGCEYGTDWVIRHILNDEIEAANLEEAFEESVRECYPEETKVGWMTFDTVTLMKEQDPISWRCALSEYESEEDSEGNIVSFDGGSTYYNLYDIEKLLDEEGVA